MVQQSHMSRLTLAVALLPAVALAGVISLFSNQVLASATDTLPAGINSPSLRMGFVTGIDQRFGSDGDLYRMGDYKSVQFTAENLSKFNARAQQLIQALNRFGTQDLGNNINFGVLKVDTKPTVNYFAPVYARGLTDRWTLGLGIPVVNYKNKITLSQENSNLAYYKSQLSGLSPELDSALNINLVNETQSTLRERGYRPIEDHNETFIGDMQLASLYRIMGDNWNGLLYSAIFNLPTGPKYNPDDLAALNVFGRTSVENKIVWSNHLNNYLEIAPFAAYTINFADRITARVPTNEDDVLPDQNSKEMVRRQVGNTASVGGDLIVSIDDQISVGAGYSYLDKERDQYSGEEGRRYDLLGQNTNSKSHRVNAQFNYSTVKSYLSKKSKMPAVLSFNYMDTLAGSNAERRTVNEMTMMMFF